ncbi:hypothetical protein [Flammeovirga pacifica]|uniref:Uncharacterized protein n=1 Tax=Flammeovirga pacifica TaxID=915059 RepID=A0A1S1Z213_FLAPC|nr:hypothetical protein [Flammeovirga pacifica]OHX67145.1 hypothetical protein NH26_12740 [Flammeovirga pacifica]
MAEYTTYRPEDQFDDTNMSKAVPSSQYYYSYSYLYKWLNIEENNDEVLQLGEGNYIKMTTIFFELNLTSTRRKFEKRHIKKLFVKKKKLILPLLSGGILGPFALFSSFSGFFELFTGFSVFLACAFLFYYGFVGNYQIEVLQKNGVQNQFFVDGNIPELESFISRCNQDFSRNNHF